MRQNNRFNEHGELDIKVPYNPNETITPGGVQGSGLGTSLNQNTGDNHNFGNLGHPALPGNSTLSRQDIGLAFSTTSQAQGLAVAADRETKLALERLGQTIEKEIANISAGTPEANKNAVDNLIKTKQSEINKNNEKFSKGFGAHPQNAHYFELFKIFFHSRLWRSSQEAADNFKEWDDAYRAGKSNQILEQSIQILKEKSKSLANSIARANQERAEKEAIQRAEKAAAEARQREANTRAKTDAERQRTEQQARETSQNQEAAHHAQLAIKAATAAPAVTPATAPQANRLAARISDAIKTIAVVKNLGPQMAAFAIAMGIPSDLGDGEQPASVATTPLSQLDLPDSANLHQLADINGTVKVSQRLLIDAPVESKPHWASTNGADVPAEVRVRHVLHNAQNNTYEFTRDGEDQPALIWTPISRPGDSTTHSPASSPDRPNPPGFPAHPITPDLETYPEADRDLLDDYILIFPDDSGLEAQYVMFKSPRYLPGKVSGEGQPFPSNWQDLAMSDNGVPISDKVAQALAGRQYSEFRNLKRAIWRETAKIVAEEGGNDINLQEMKKGNAPYVERGERRPGRNQFEIHHKTPISQGGEVYDIENLVLLTPKKHDQLHQSMREKGAP